MKVKQKYYLGKPILPPGGDEFWSKPARDLAQILITFGKFNRRELLNYLVNHYTIRNIKIQERHVEEAAGVIRRLRMRKKR